MYLNLIFSEQGETQRLVLTFDGGESIEENTHAYRSH